MITHNNMNSAKLKES